MTSLSSSAPESKTGVAKFYARFQQSIRDENFYEAEQICRTIFLRLASQGRGDAAADFLRKAAALFNERSQFNCSADLVTLLLDSLESGRLDASEHAMACVAEVIESLPAACVMTDPCIKRSLKYASSCHRKDHLVFLHRVYAKKWLQERSWEKAISHATRGLLGDECGQAAAHLLIEEIAVNDVGNAEMSIAVPIFELLCLKSAVEAKAAMRRFVDSTETQLAAEHHLSSPALDALRHLIDACSAANADESEFLAARDKALHSLASVFSEKKLQSYLDRIGEVYFDIKPKKSSDDKPNFLNLLQSMNMPTSTETEMSDVSAPVAYPIDMETSPPASQSAKPAAPDIDLD